MNGKTIWRETKWVLTVAFSAVIFALGFDLFLETSDINCGGVSGIAMIVKELLGKETVFGLSTIALFTFLINIPLFFGGYRKIGKRFFFGSLLGVVLCSAFMDLFYPLEAFFMEINDRLLSAVVGGVMLGLSLGISFYIGASTGGSDIAARLLKLKFRDLPIGKLTLVVDVVVIVLTGVVYKNIVNAIYSAVTLYVSSVTIDAVVYRFDYSKIAIIISDKHEQIARAIDENLKRGVTFLHARGYYRSYDKFVILCAVKRHQVAELQKLVVSIDKNAFVIIHEAHQVLGDGFHKYSDTGL